MREAFLLVLAFALCASTALAQSTASGPFGGAAEIVRVVPLQPDHVLAATANGLVYQSCNIGVEGENANVAGRGTTGVENLWGRRQDRPTISRFPSRLTKSESRIDRVDQNNYDIWVHDLAHLAAEKVGGGFARIALDASLNIEPLRARRAIGHEDRALEH